jgi:CRISPR system Cascade subunit CasA
MNNLLHDPLIRIESETGIERLSLPGVLAALVADRVESFPALRAHQGPAWHMLLAQLGAIAMHRAGLAKPPAEVDVWRDIIQALTKTEFPDDEPWHLVVADRSRPAFMQPPVPEGVTLDSVGVTPDALDMLITSKNHDLKQAVAASAGADDWIFAMINLQTCEGYGGSGNYGVARMNGGSSSRALVGLAPMCGAIASSTGVRIGKRFTRDVAQLVARRAALLEALQVGYPNEGGSALLWNLPWPQGAKLALSQLDPYFIEVCRRIRLSGPAEALTANIGTSSAARINAEAFKGAIGDPWAPVHVLENKALTLGDEGEFDYKRIVDLMFSGNWTPPLLATLGPGEDKDATNWALVVQAFARGNSKTGGFKERSVPLTGRTAKRIGPRFKELHELAKQQIAEIEKVNAILRGAIALAAAGGDAQQIAKKHRIQAQPAGHRLNAQADRIFFEALWQRFDAEQSGVSDRVVEARRAFVVELVATAKALLAEALADIACSAIHRPRAAARAERRFRSGLRHKDFGFPEFFAPDPVAAPVAPAEETAHDAA